MLPLHTALGRPTLLAAILLAACDEAPRALERPNRILLDAQGQLHVSDFHHQRVVVFDQDDQPAGIYGAQGLGPGGLWQVRALASGPGPGIWLANQRIRSADDEDTVWEVKNFVEGKEREAWVIPPVEDVESQWVEAMIAMPGGDWLVVDSGHDGLIRYDEAWQIQEVWAAPTGLVAPSEDTPPAPLPFLGVSSATLAGDQLWVVEQRGHRVRLLDLQGRQIMAFGHEGRQPGELRFPQAIAVCPERWLMVADLGNYRVQRFDLEGRFMDGFEPEPAVEGEAVQLLDLTLSADCERTFLVDSKGSRVLVTTPTGEVLRSWDRWEE